MFTSSIDSAISNVLAAQQLAVKAQIGTAVQAKALDSAKVQGDAAVQLLEAATRLSKSLTSGRMLDLVG